MTTERLARQRGWLTAAYCLAAVLSQGWHAHPEGPEADHHDHEVVACDVEGLHLDAQPHCSREHLAGDCFSCQFHSNHLAWLDRPQGLPTKEGDDLVALPIADGTSCPLSRPRGRSPPL